MHGTAYRDKESCRNLRRSSSQHMRSALHFLHSASSRIDLAAAGDHHSSAAAGDHDSSATSYSTSNTTSTDFFFKDGRKICVGDCALFKPSQDSPPFIGLIRCLNFKEDGSLHLGVNWLYRPTELKLGKGSLLDCAPNELFYSFHKDEIPAASLLHPCKVAFLPRGVELPTGTFSSVCRRVYDISNKCLWSLTDHDYIDERQEEVDLLLYKTRTEMHVMLQPSDRSPEQVNSPSSAAKLKPGCDSGQNSGTSFSSHGKGRKRGRGDSVADTVKRDRSSKTDDGDTIQCKSVSNLKSEIARITENGGVTDLNAVEKLIHLMQSDIMERNKDLLSRSMLVGVMAATDKVDCLNGFVQFKGLLVLDAWLQDIHKGKIGENYSLKDGDKSVDEFLLILLRSLDKLPVNLNALQMCNIGKSVNHLRSHKNLEIQRKARSLVDTWKKRVEAEMINIDTKSGSPQAMCVWPSKSHISEVPHGGVRNPSGPEVLVKGSVTLSSASKTVSARSSHGESNIKSETSSSDLSKSNSSPASGKESQPRVPFTSEVPFIREDRSSSSNQPNDCTQSFACKEEGKSSAGLTTGSKILNSTTSTRKHSDSDGGSIPGSKEQGSSLNENIFIENCKSTSNEKVLEVPITEGNSDILKVMIPNGIMSSPHGVTGKSAEDPTFISSHASSEVLLEKPEQFDLSSKDQSDAYVFNADSDMNTESWQSGDLKDLLNESGEAAGSPAALHDEERSMTTKDSPKNQLNLSKLHKSSFSPMNALIESCVKYSAGNSSSSLKDEVGMNLLASVATREIAKLDSPTDSTDVSTNALPENCVTEEAISKHSPEKYISGVGSQFSVQDDCGDKKQAAVYGCSLPEDRLHLLEIVPVKFDGGLQCDPSASSEYVPAGAVYKHIVPSSTELRKNADSERNEKTGTTSLKLPVSTEKVTDNEFIEKIHAENATSNTSSSNGAINCKSDEISVKVSEGNAVPALEDGKLTADLSGCNKLCEIDDENGSNEEENTGTQVLQKVVVLESESSEKGSTTKLLQGVYSENSVLDDNVETNISTLTENNAVSCANELKGLKFDEEVSKDADIGSHRLDALCTTANDLKSDKESYVKKVLVVENISVAEYKCLGFVDSETKKKGELEGSVSTTNQQDDAEKCAIVEACLSTTRPVDPNAKMKFDLNEGFSVDDKKYGETINSVASHLETVLMCNSLQCSVNSAPITVAAAAKGSFVPPEDLIRSKGEAGWKGSAATSAFRPAEPRKHLETTFGTASMPYSDVSTNKNARVILDIDLNVPDERVLQEMVSRDSDLAVDSTNDFVKRPTLLNDAPDFFLVRDSVGLDLDLNRDDDINNNAHFTVSSNHRKRDFDLNDGHVVDNISEEQLVMGKKAKDSIPAQLPSSGLRMNSSGLVSFPSWFPPPSILPDRVDQSFQVFPPPASQRSFGPVGFTPFTHDLYRGPVLSSSPAAPFSSGHFQFPVFPFGTTFPLPSSAFSVGANSYADSLSGAKLFAPPVNSQFLGPVGPFTAQFPRPYMVNISDNRCGDALENDRKWDGPGLDLNAGPGVTESEVREHSVGSSQAVLEDQSRLQSASGLKRKDPEGGWDNESVRYKQFSWH